MEKKDFQEMLDKQSEELEQKFVTHVDAIKEDMDHRMDAIFEYVQDIPAIKEKLDLTFEKVGEIAVDVEILKQSARDHEQRIKFLEN